MLWSILITVVVTGVEPSVKEVKPDPMHVVFVSKQACEERARKMWTNITWNQKKVGRMAATQYAQCVPKKES